MAKKFLDAIEHKFKESSKIEIENIISNFTNVKYDNVGRVRDYL